MADIDSFLDRLMSSASSADKIFLVNLHDCCVRKLVTPDEVESFLLECATTPGSPVSVVSRVSKRRFLRMHKRDPSDLVGSVVDHTLSYTTFRACHVNDAPPATVATSILPNPPPSPEQEDELDQLAEDIEQITRQPEWYKSSALMGSPDGNCWVSVNRFEDPKDTKLYDGSSLTSADKVRDELGLIDYGAETHLISYTLRGDALAALEATLEMARPMFADLGNSRFRVACSCRRSEAMEAAGWGCTTHLGRFPDPALHPVSGRPERVTRRLPLNETPLLQVIYRRGTKATRGLDITDDDDAFLALVLGRGNLHDIKKEIVEFIRPAK